MAKRQPKTEPTWKDVKAKLTNYNQAELLGLIQNLYAAQKENKTFLHARLGLGADVLEPYKEIIDRWLWPDVAKGQDFSVAKAKQAISDYRKAVGDPAGLAELKVFCCEQAEGFCNQYGFDGDAYLDALVLTFAEALTITANLPAKGRTDFMERLAEVRDACQDFGCGVGHSMNSLLAEWEAANGSAEEIAN
jgi:hypothetical protein